MQFQNTITCRSCSQCIIKSLDNYSIDDLDDYTHYQVNDVDFTAVILSNETEIYASAFSTCPRLIAVIVPT